VCNAGKTPPELRQECYKEAGNPRWEPFRLTYELLDLGWFDNLYFDKGGYNEQNLWVIQERGFHHHLMKRLAAYIKAHRVEFIEEPLEQW